MSEDILRRLGRQLLEARRRRRWTLSDVARRIARQPARISEMESGKANSTLESIAAVGQVLGLSLVFVPEDKLATVQRMIGAAEPPVPAPRRVTSVLDDVFVRDEDEPDEG